MSMVLLETSRGLLCNIYYYRINKLCIKLVIEKVYVMINGQKNIKIMWKNIVKPGMSHTTI
jgi:hypothetical protein